MKRREFNGVLGMAILTSSFNFKPKNSMKRIAMSTVNFRNRFIQTNKLVSNDKKLSLLQVPEYFRSRFNIKNLEFWSRHFESNEQAYLLDLKKAIKNAGCKLVNIQMDEKYQIGAIDDSQRKESLEIALKWVDVAKTVNSKAIRINP